MSDIRTQFFGVAAILMGSSFLMDIFGLPYSEVAIDVVMAALMLGIILMGVHMIVNPGGHNE